MTRATSRGRGGSHAPGMRMDGVDEDLHMFHGCELVDAVAEVEDMGRPGAVADMRRAETLQYRARFVFDRARVGEEHSRIEVALQRLAAADLFARLAQVHGPVHAQHVAIESLHLAQPGAPTFREHD